MMKSSYMAGLALTAGLSLSFALQAQETTAPQPPQAPALSIDLDSLGDTLDQLKESEDLRRDPFATQDRSEDDAVGQEASETEENQRVLPENPFAGPDVVAVLQGLDKVTARISPVNAPVGQAVRFGALEITTRYCRETPPTEAPETWVFLEIRDVKEGVAPRALFSGWMIESSPGLSSLAHPVYDIVVKGCTTMSVVSGDHAGNADNADNAGDLGDAPAE